MKTLPREPWRGGQICGYQIAYGLPRSIFCGELKVLGRYFCQEHHDWVILDGPIRMARGNAQGLRLRASRWGWSVTDRWGQLCASADNRAQLEETYGFTLLWEGEDDRPATPTDDELHAFQKDSP